MIEKLYTVEEVAELASVTGRTIRNYLKSGRLVGRKIGGQWRFPEAEVQRLLTGAEPEDEPPAEAPAVTAPVQPVAYAPAPEVSSPAGEFPLVTDFSTPEQAPVPPSTEQVKPAPAPYIIPDSTLSVEDESPIFNDEAPPVQPAARPANGYHAQPAPLPQPEAPAASAAAVAPVETAPQPVLDVPTAPVQPPVAPAAAAVSAPVAQPQPVAPAVPQASAPTQVQTVYGQPAYPQQTAQPQPAPAYTPGEAPPAATSGYATFEQPPVFPAQNQPTYVVPVIPAQYDTPPVQNYTFAAPAPLQYQPGVPGYYVVPQAMMGVPPQPAPVESTKTSADKPESAEPVPAPKTKPAPELSDVGNRVTRFMSQVHDCSYGPAMCAVVDMNQSLESAKLTSERLNEIADMESNEAQPCQCFVEFDDRYFIARYTLFGSTHFLLRCLNLIG